MSRLRESSLLHTLWLSTLLLIIAMPADAHSKVLVLGDWASEKIVSIALRSAGYDVEVVGLYAEWDGAYPPAADFDVIVLIDGLEYGNELQPGAVSALQAHVAGGKGLVYTEWTAYDASVGTFASAAADLSPVVSPNGEESYDGEWTVTDTEHPLTLSLPSTWTDPASYSIVTLRPGAVSVVTDAGGVPMVSFTEANGGRVVHLNHAFAYDEDEAPISPHILQLLANAIAFVSGEPPSVLTGDLLILGDGGSEFSLALGLSHLGLRVVFGGIAANWDGQYPDPAGFDTIAYLNGVDYGFGLKPEAEQALVDFVQGGGGLILTEWTAYDASIGVFGAGFQSLIPVERTEGAIDGFQARWIPQDPSHPMVFGLPTEWTDPSYYSPVELTTAAEVIVAGTDDVPLVAELAIGSGKTVFINQPLAYFDDFDAASTNAYATRLIANAVSYLGGLPPILAPAPRDVLLLGDEYTEIELLHEISSAGLSVTFGGRYDRWDGSYPNPADHSVILFLDGWEFGQGMLESAESAILNHVTGGGGLVATEWTSYDVWEETLGEAINTVLPVIQPEYQESTNADWNIEDSNHPVVEGLPATWMDPTGYSFVEAKPTATVLVRSTTGTPMVTVDSSLGGTSVHLNHDMTFTRSLLGPEIRRLIVNSLRFAGGISGEGPTADLNGNGRVEADDLVTLIEALGQSGSPADLDSNGMVDKHDLWIFLTYWASEI